MARIAIPQFVSSADPAVNRAKLVSLVEAAATAGADLIAFHELATTDYFCYDDRHTEHFALAEPVPGPSTRAVAAAAHDAGVSVILPLYEQGDGLRFNTVVYIDADTGIVGKYRKSHVPVLGTMAGQKGANEGFYFSPGTTGFVVPPLLAGLSVGTLVCYDRHFPEAGRAYVLAGVDVIFVPTASYRAAIVDEMWLTELQTLAFQNCVYVVGINKIGAVHGEGVDADARYPGKSAAYDPHGHLLTQLGSSETIGYVDVDSEVRKHTQSGAFSVLAARRPELYGSLTEPVTSARPLASATL